MRLTILKYVLVFCVALIAYLHGLSIEISNQMPLYEGLRNTSSIIFGVMGAWLAILYPDSLKKIFGGGSQKLPEQEKQTIMLLFQPIIISTTVIAVVLILFPLFQVGKTINQLDEYKDVFRGLSFSLLSILTILQLWALILTLVPSDLVKKHIDKQNTKQEVVKRMFSGTTKRTKPDK